MVTILLGHLFHKLVSVKEIAGDLILYIGPYLFITSNVWQEAQPILPWEHDYEEDADP